MVIRRTWLVGALAVLGTVSLVRVAPAERSIRWATSSNGKPCKLCKISTSR